MHCRFTKPSGYLEKKKSLLIINAQTRRSIDVCHDNILWKFQVIRQSKTQNINRDMKILEVKCGQKRNFFAKVQTHTYLKIFRHLADFRQNEVQIHHSRDSFKNDKIDRGVGGKGGRWNNGVTMSILCDIYSESMVPYWFVQKWQNLHRG